MKKSSNANAGPLPPTGPEGRTLAHDERLKIDEQGVILGVTKFYPDVLPLSGIDFEKEDWPLFYVFALTNKGGVKKGQRYLVKAVSATGGLLIHGAPGFHNMTDFVKAFRGVFEPEAANDDAAKPEA